MPNPLNDESDPPAAAPAAGMRKGPTIYGDPGFSLFLHRAFIKGAGYTDSALSKRASNGSLAWTLPTAWRAWRTRRTRVDALPHLRANRFVAALAQDRSVEATARRDRRRPGHLSELLAPAQLLDYCSLDTHPWSAP